MGGGVREIGEAISKDKLEVLRDAITGRVKAG